MKVESSILDVQCSVFNVQYTMFNVESWQNVVDLLCDAFQVVIIRQRVQKQKYLKYKEC